MSEDKADLLYGAPEIAGYLNLPCPSVPLGSPEAAHVQDRCDHLRPPVQLQCLARRLRGQGAGSTARGRRTALMRRKRNVSSC